MKRSWRDDGQRLHTLLMEIEAPENIRAPDDDDLQVDSMDLSDDEENILNQEIWSSLPTDAVERVMLWLPIRSLMRVRSVCKGWNSVILSKGFTDLYLQVPNQNPWLLIFPKNDASIGLAYDSSSGSWFELPFSFLPFESRVVATGAGMVCLVPKATHCKVWIVCNPISKFWKELPSPPGLLKLFFLVVGMFVDEDSRSFKIVMAGSKLVAEDSEKFLLTTEVYDSSLLGWRRGGSILLDAPLSPWKATSGGIMYCVTGSLPYRVLAYDVNRGIWFKLRAQLPQNLTSARLVDHQGQLLLVGGIGQHGLTTEIGMWKLNGSGSGWTEVGWMPKQLCNDLLKSLSRRFVCIGQGDLLFFSNKKCQGVLEHNLLRRSWCWIPIAPSVVNFHYYMLRGFHFQPKMGLIRYSRKKTSCV